jgi:glycerol transport system ATP-binding protein
VTQFGPTPDVYRRPGDAITARVFSDPPMNFVGVTRANGRLSFDGDMETSAFGALTDLPDGRYMAGFRPDHLRIHRGSGDDLAFEAHVSVTELTGSESFVHMNHAGRRWVALVHGVHDLPTGRTREVFVDPRHIYLFGEDDRLVSAAPYARAA